MTLSNSLRGPLAALVMVALAPLAGAQEPAKAVPTAKPVAATPVAKATPAIRPLSVTVDLISKTKIAGTLTDTTQLEMKTSFGAAQIPLSEVAGIKFASADDASTTVVMLNGDSITGATDVKLITVETEWGVAQINGSSISSILFVGDDVVWSPVAGLNGKRWNLAEKKPAPPQPPAQQQRTTRPSVIPTNQFGQPFRTR
ncbi:MAG: hypothetical protein AAGA03_03475 [Planctomycetota bacterium]